MLKIIILSAVMLCHYEGIAQIPYNSAVPNGYTKKASVYEQVGLTEISISYHRPAVNGREGKIWGGVVHTGFTDQGFGNGKPAPWRAGANENTIIELDNDAKVEGQALPKGRYGLFIAYDPTECTVIFSRRSDSWGSFFYNQDEDVLRVKVKPQTINNNVEYLEYKFINQTPNSAHIALSWEKLSIPFKIEVDNLKQQFDAFVSESQNPRGFTSQGLNIAANWSLQNNYELEKGLEWANKATSTNFPGDPTSFTALTTRSKILEKLGENEEAATVLKNALPHGNMMQLHQYGRQLLAAKNLKGALEIFEINHKKYPDQFVTLTGMARGLSANGNYKNALQFAEKALKIAPDEKNKKAVEEMIVELKAGR